MPQPATSSSTVSAPTPSPARWGWRLAALGMLLAGLVVVGALFFLDPWLRRTLEKQVTSASHGRYELRIRYLRTHLWSGSATLQGVQLRTIARTTPDTTKLPDLRLDLHELRVAGIGLLAVLQQAVVPIDSVVAKSGRLRLGSWPTGTTGTAPLHAQLPLGLKGLRVGYAAVQNVQARYGTVRRAQGRIDRATLQAHDVLLSAAGAADTTRLGYARHVRLHLTHLRANTSGHLVALRRGLLSSDSQRLEIGGLRVVPLRPVSGQRSAAARLDLALPAGTLHGLRVAALPRGTLRADSLVLGQGRLAVTLPAQVPPPPHQVLAPYLPRIRVGVVRVAGAAVRVLGIAEAPAVRDLRLTARQVYIAPETYSAPDYLYYARSWQVQTGPGRVLLDAPYYRASYSALRADTRRGLLLLRTVHLAPTLTVAAQARRKGHQSAHVTARVAQVRLLGLDFTALLRNGSWLARQAEISGARLVTRSDGRFPINPKPSVATPEAIGRLAFRVDVRQVRVIDAGIRMVYRSPRSAQPGVLAIQQLAATLRNLSNDPRRMGPTRPLTGEATGLLQRQSRARLALRANLLDPAGRHTLRGSFTATPLAILNPMVTTTRGIRFRSGQIGYLRFVMSLDRQQARGTMWAEYADLKLDLLNRKNKRGVLHRIGTSLANGVFLRDNNPRQPGQPLKPGRMHSARELRYSVFSLWRQGLVSGLLHSAGVPSKLAKRLSESE